MDIMRTSLLSVLVITLIIAGCTMFQPNPFFQEWNTPHGTPPFSQIKEFHYLPAFKAAFKQQQEEVEAIVTNTAPPTFSNTIEALDYSGALLNKVDGVFYNLRSAHTNDNLQAIAKTISPIRSKHRDDIYLNEALFERIKAVYSQKDQLDLNTEQAMLLEETYKAFVRGGANLSPEKKARFREINEKLSMLSLQFGENVLKENNRFELVIEDKKNLAGLPESVIQAASETATERGHEGKWVFTIHKPSLIPFLQYSEKRNLRKKMFNAYIMKGDHDDELDNKKILAEMAALRVEKAHLLGYPTHAHFILEENMAQDPKGVYELLDKLWSPALKMAQKEAGALQEMIDKEGGNFKLEPWDWWYYTEKLRKAKYDLDEDELRPYFQVDNVREGVFKVANKLYGITFTPRDDIEVYHEDVKVFELKEADGTHIGILFVDYFPRASKRGGAWMNSYRKQQRINGEMITPIIVNVGNFTKPTADKPALISLDETLTLFHEFGHAMHGLLSNCTYYSLSGTSVSRDFVELPSQIMEHWALEPEVLKMYAKHYKTGEPIPDALIKKIKASSQFNQGFATVEYLAASYLDMFWHTMKEAEIKNVNQFEDKVLNKIGLIPEIESRYRSTYFQHIFAGGYSSGYYSYIWSEWLDCDAFEAFKETTLFDKKTATAFRENILAKGGTEEPMNLYVKFRGRKPKIEPILENRGLL